MKFSIRRLSQKHSSAIKRTKTEPANKEPNIKSKTNWEPKKNYRTVETFIEAVKKDIVERFSDKKKLPKSDLTDTDKNAVEYFSKCNDLVITKADKGGATVILDVKDYIAKANEQLQDDDFYQKLNAEILLPNILKWSTVVL